MIKSLERKYTLLNLVSNMDNYDALRGMGKILKPSMKALDFCHPALRPS